MSEEVALSIGNDLREGLDLEKYTTNLDLADRMKASNDAYDRARQPRATELQFVNMIIDQQRADNLPIDPGGARRLVLALRAVGLLQFV